MPNGKNMSNRPKLTVDNRTTLKFIMLMINQYVSLHINKEHEIPSQLRKMLRMEINGNLYTQLEEYIESVIEGIPCVFTDEEHEWIRKYSNDGYSERTR